ncbi:MFS transporter [Pseudomonas aeruginosa]|nr:MFS transporter [Pseudomonas aeruginosa]
MGRREAFPENAGAAASAVAPRLPLSALLAMAMSGFVAILSETLPAGLLPQIGAGLAVSEALAGQLVSVYALGSLLAALPAASLTQGWRRRRVLLLALLIFFVCNSLTAVSSDYRLTLLARFGSGVAAGLAWGLLAGYARRLVPPEQQGRALAVAMLGAPLALFAVAALALCLGARWSWLAFAGLALWGLTFGGAATLLQTASADAAGEGADLAQSMIVVAWNLAIAGGGALGGMVLQRWGSEMLPWTLLPLIGLAAVLVWGNAAHAFRVGPRDFRRASSEHRKAAQ